LDPATLPLVAVILSLGQATLDRAVTYLRLDLDVYHISGPEHEPSLPNFIVRTG
jgi:hypothetical protein